MAQQQSHNKPTESNYETAPHLPPSSSPLYPTVHSHDLHNLFPDQYDANAPNDAAYFPTAPPEPTQQALVTIPGVIVHLIDTHYSVELATGDLTILGLRQGDDALAALAVVDDDIQWPLSEDIAAVKLDSSHYFFSFQPPRESEEESEEVLNYGLTIVSNVDEGLVDELDRVFENYCNFTVQNVDEKLAVAVDGGKKKKKKKKKDVEGQCAAYWTTLAPNVEEYSGTAARMIATGSGHLVKGILWCGDVTLDRLKSGNEVLRKRVAPGTSDSEIDPATLKRIQRVKRVTKLTEKVAGGVLSGVLKVSGRFTSSVANSKVGKRFFRLLPGEVVVASLDGFNRVCDAAEVAGKNVLSSSSTMTTELVYHRYGEEASKAAGEGLDAAGHAIGTAWNVFKIRQALNPKSALKPATMARSAAKSAVADKKKSKSSK